MMHSPFSIGRPKTGDFLFAAEMRRRIFIWVPYSLSIFLSIGQISPLLQANGIGIKKILQNP